jgi:hypothetical protein
MRFALLSMTAATMPRALAGRSKLPSALAYRTRLMDSRIAFVEGLKSTGQPFANTITSTAHFGVASYSPRTHGLVIRWEGVVPAFKGGDTNGDGVLDISDAVSGLPDLPLLSPLRVTRPSTAKHPTRAPAEGP